MLGFAPLAALPPGFIAIAAQASASGGIVFSGSAFIGAVTPMAATGGITFGGSAFVTTHVYRSATGAISFGGSPLLTVAGKPLVFAAIPQAFVFRADGADYAMTAVRAAFDFRGTK